jgi:two-component system, NtrC family, response regulator GlrR
MSDKNLDDLLPLKFVGSSRALQQMLQSIRRFACTKAPILITGESGTGKELVAQAAHYLSDRNAGPFVPVNCGALPDSLVESELFGHAKGAFTDANRARQGLIREAQGGTLFLDEVESLSPRAQAVLLRFLQDSSFRSLGEERSSRAEVRVIAASNVELRQMVEKGAFRLDLLFRLDVLPIRVPPLRERRCDVPFLVEHFLAKAASSESATQKRASAVALEMLSAYAWPGNVRELEHLVFRAHLMSPAPVIDVYDFLNCHPSLAGTSQAQARCDLAGLRDEKRRAVQEVERRFVERALASSGGNISAAARLCNMERAVLSRMAKRSGRGCLSANATD